MATFDITRPKDSIRLDPDGRGDIPFTVTNVSVKSIRARLEIKAENPADLSIFTIEGGLDRNLRPNETLNIRVLVAAGSATSAGPHKFWLKVVDTESPDDFYAESQSVEFLVPQREAHDGKLKFPWWIIPAAAMLVLIIAGTGWYLYAYPKVPDYRTLKADAAAAELKDKFDVKVITTDIVLDPEQDGLVVMQTVDGKPFEAGRLKRGTRILLQVSGLMPKLVGRTLIEAQDKLAEKKFPQAVKINSSPSQDPGTWNIVQAQEPDPGPPVKAGNGSIQLWLNVKPDVYTVPDFVAQHKTYCEAVSILGANGVNAVESFLPVPLPVQAGQEFVLSQLPIGNQTVFKGGSVTLTHAGAPVRCWTLDLRLAGIENIRVFSLDKVFEQQRKRTKK